MAFVYFSLFVFVLFFVIYFFNNLWVSISRTDLDKNEELYEAYDYLKQNNIRCMLEQAYLYDFADDNKLNLFVHKKDLEKAKGLLERRSKRLSG